MPNVGRIDTLDAQILLLLFEQPRATTIAIAERAGISRNTAQSRIARLEASGALASFERRVTAESLGYPLTAFITTQVTQRRLNNVSAALADIPEVLQVHGISGPVDLLVHVVATDAEDLYRVAGQILAIPGVERTNTSLVMRQLVDYRIAPLVHHQAIRGSTTRNPGD